jgi:hypothetical protein
LLSFPIEEDGVLDDDRRPDRYARKWRKFAKVIEILDDGNVL